jgi:hypothetical protein
MVRRSMRTQAFLATAMLAATAAGARAQSETEIASLERIGKLEIVVTEFEGAAAELGVASGVLGSLLDTKLRQEGVPVAGFAVASSPWTSRRFRSRSAPTSCCTRPSLFTSPPPRP